MVVPALSVTTTLNASEPAARYRASDRQPCRRDGEVALASESGAACDGGAPHRRPRPTLQDHASALAAPHSCRVQRARCRHQNRPRPRTRRQRVEALQRTGKCCTQCVCGFVCVDFPAAAPMARSPIFCVNESRFSSAASPHIAVHVAAAFRIGLHIRQTKRTLAKWLNSAGLAGAAGVN